jgi:hypothetical protein
LMVRARRAAGPDAAPGAGAADPRANATKVT